ncbi:4a-hydroxytetrahydrobiopterin dehydratase [Thioflexithrix psekupsensis]|uniref:Putative pterin-4-alpha-carbinolamine dehydratase n=1 Tax=Thioflexithrix psekupsensis TaxID=1570016 RepID=A0A251X9W5_9GAMM|nr:4a-hydroxytetrahydrobiopterin dehydratase [Thioflexithrix psekupsensis]OUD14974.1 4a-hydroxytetrahydrobiopterin dehydratase [Thioflexithrix psekupsensis]
MSDLASQHCKVCEGGVSPLTPQEASRLLNKLAQQWQLSDDGREIMRTFQFKNFYETMAFVNAVAWIAHREDHHPELTVGYKTCVIHYSTHALNGLSENDFICAAKIDALVA